MSTTQKYVFQWGVSGYTIDNPAKEEIETFMRRKQVTNEEGVIPWLIVYKNMRAAYLEFFVGTDEEFVKYRKELPTKTDADKGILAMMISDCLVYMSDYIQIKINNMKKQMIDSTWNALDSLRNNDLTTYDHLKNDYLTVEKPAIDKWENYLNAFNEYELELSELSLGLPLGKIPTERTDFTLILKDIKDNDANVYATLHKIFEIDEILEPEAFKKEIETIFTNLGYLTGGTK